MIEWSDQKPFFSIQRKSVDIVETVVRVKVLLALTGEVEVEEVLLVAGAVDWRQTIAPARLELVIVDAVRVLFQRVGSAKFESSTYLTDQKLISYLYQCTLIQNWCNIYINIQHEMSSYCKRSLLEGAVDDCTAAVVCAPKLSRGRVLLRGSLVVQDGAGNARVLHPAWVLPLR